MRYRLQDMEERSRSKSVPQRPSIRNDTRAARLGNEVRA